MINNIINAMAEERFRLRAFSDYCEDRAAAYSNLIAATTDATSQSEEVELSNIPNVVQTICEKFNIDPNTQVTLQSGYAGTVQQFLQKVMTNTSIYINDDAAFENDAAYSITDAAGDVINSLQFDDLMNDMKTGYHSLVVLCASNAAFLSEKISDRFTVFRDKLSQVFANAYDDASSMGSYCTELLQNCSRPQEYLDQVFSRLNVEEVAADDSQEIPANSDIYRFTGASPLGALDFSSVTAAAGSVLNAGAKVVAGIGKVLWTGAKWLFNKAKKFVTEIVADPYDIYKLDGVSKDASPSVDGFFYQSDTVVDYFTPTYSVPEEVMNSMTGSYYTVKLITGEVVLQVNSVDQGGGSGELSCDYMIQLKPYPITKDFAWAILDLILNDGYTKDGVAYRRANWNSNNINQLSTKLAALVATTPNPYYDVSDPEVDLHMGYNLGYLITSLILRLSSIEAPIITGINPTATLTWESLIQPTFSADDVFSPLTSVTNREFIKAVCGYDETTNLFNVNSGNWGLVVKNDDFWNSLLLFDNVGWYYFSTMLLLQVYKSENPLEYQFFAYRKDKERFTESMYAIHTDEENKDVANRFMVIAITVLAIVAAVVIGAVVAKGITKALTLAKARKTNVANLKLSSGAKLSWSEKRAILRGKKATQVSSSCSQGLLGSLSEITSTDSADISAILGLIA